jgi:two-component system nitrate/nitrite response regulator NarL
MPLAVRTSKSTIQPKGLVTSLVVADGDPVVLLGLSTLLGQEPDFKVIAMCKEGDAALEAILKYSPTIALLDLNLPKMSGLEVLARASMQMPATRVVFFTSSTKHRGVLVAVRRGARGIITKESLADTLIRCLRRVSSGQRCLPRALMMKERQRLSQIAAINATLTAREREVVRIAAEGLCNKRLAARLGISEGTAKLHLHHVYSKTGTSSRSALASLALCLADASDEYESNLLEANSRGSPRRWPT